MYYVDLGQIGSRLDLIGATTYPAWMGLCSKLPFLIRNGAIYSTSVYPLLGFMLGSTFGGNGINTFGVPDSLSRLDLPIDTTGVNRITAAISGINGTTMGSAGGNQSMQSHSHPNTLTDPGHGHVTAEAYFANIGGSGILAAGGTYIFNAGSNVVNPDTTGITLTNANSGIGGSQNVPPAIVSHLPLIRAG
jgi:microcystin-dependent protein